MSMAEFKAQTGDQTSLKSKFVRAGLVGACLGVVIIGLLENADRFSDPQAIYHDARLEPTQVGQLNTAVAPDAAPLDAPLAAPLDAPLAAPLGDPLAASRADRLTAERP